MKAIVLICIGIVCATGAFAQESKPIAPAGGLTDALKAVLLNHPAVKAKAALVRASGAELSAAKREWLPSLTAEAVQADGGEASGLIRLSQPLYTFGRLSAPIDEADARQNLARMDLLATQRELIEQTAQAYAVLQTLRKRLSIAKENLAAHEVLFEQVKRRAEGKLASEADVSLSESRMAESQITLGRIQGQITIALKKLRSLTQIEVPSDQPINPVDLGLTPATLTPEALIARNAPVGQAQAERSVAQQQVRGQQLSEMPTISARLGHEFFDDSNTEVALVISGSLGGLGFVNRSRVDAQQAVLEATQYQLQLARVQQAERIEQLMENRQVQEQLMLIQITALRSLKPTLDSYGRQYLSGRRQWIDLLNMQREFSQQLDVTAQLEGEWLNYSVQIAAVAGYLDHWVGLK